MLSKHICSNAFLYIFLITLKEILIRIVQNVKQRKNSCAPYVERHTGHFIIISGNTIQNMGGTTCSPFSFYFCMKVLPLKLQENWHEFYESWWVVFNLSFFCTFTTRWHSHWWAPQKWEWL